MTDAELLWIVKVAVLTNSIIFWWRDRFGDAQPALMPANPWRWYTAPRRPQPIH